MTAQPSEPKLTRERVQLTIDAEAQFPGSQDSYKFALAQSWLDQYEALEQYQGGTMFTPVGPMAWLVRFLFRVKLVGWALSAIEEKEPTA